MAWEAGDGLYPYLLFSLSQVPCRNWGKNINLSLTGSLKNPANGTWPGSGKRVSSRSYNSGKLFFPKSNLVFPLSWIPCCCYSRYLGNRNWDLLKNPSTIYPEFPTSTSWDIRGDYSIGHIFFLIRIMYYCNQWLDRYSIIPSNCIYPPPVHNRCSWRIYGRFGG